MSNCDTSAGDFFLSLTGFDEIAISREFGEDVSRLLPNKDNDGGNPFRWLRSLVFVHQRREGLKDREAFKAAQEIPIRQLQDYFADDEPELDPDDPDTPAGKEPSASA